MQGARRHTGGWKAGSAVFLVLALLLAVFSGDILLVLAVATAIAGLTLVTQQRSRAAVHRPAAVPLTSRTVAATRVADRPRTRFAGSRRMAVRRYRSAFSGRTQTSTAADGAAHSSVAEAPGQAQVIQVLQ